MKLTVTPVKTLFGKKSGQFRAELGSTGWACNAPSKEQAVAELTRQLTETQENLFRRKYVRKGNVTFVLYHARGWCYDIVRDDGTASSSHINARNYSEAVERMMNHVNQHDGVWPMLTLPYIDTSHYFLTATAAKKLCGGTLPKHGFERNVGVPAGTKLKYPRREKTLPTETEGWVKRTPLSHWNGKPVRRGWVWCVHI